MRLEQDQDRHDKLATETPPGGRGESLRVVNVIARTEEPQWAVTQSDLVVPRYTEVFIDEGDVDMLEAMKTYRAAGYDGPFVSDHTPSLEGDTPWGHRGRTFSHGYMRALVQAVNAT